MTPPEYERGWIRDDAAVAAITEILPYGDLSQTDLGQVPVEDLPAQVYLWDLARKVTGGLLPPRNQGKIGSCVAFGTVRAIEYTMCAEIVAGQPEQFQPLSTEVIYGGSRVEVGKGRLRNDGSIGAWAATFVRDWGVVARAQYGDLDLSTYSETTCRTMGKEGVPDTLETVARLHPVRQVTTVKDWKQAKIALANGYGIAVCSDQGFTMSRNKDGIADPSGTWNHCMCLCGYAVINNREYGRIDNSWGGSSHTGPVGPGSPGPEGFWADANRIQYMLSSGDCWIFSSVDGFLVKQIDWTL